MSALEHAILASAKIVLLISATAFATYIIYQLIGYSTFNVAVSTITYLSDQLAADMYNPGISRILTIPQAPLGGFGTIIYNAEIRVEVADGTSRQFNMSVPLLYYGSPVGTPLDLGVTDLIHCSTTPTLPLFSVSVNNTLFGTPTTGVTGFNWMVIALPRLVCVYKPGGDLVLYVVNATIGRQCIGTLAYLVKNVDIVESPGGNVSRIVYRIGNSEVVEELGVEVSRIYLVVSNVAFDAESVGLRC